MQKIKVISLLLLMFTILIFTVSCSAEKNSDNGDAIQVEQAEDAVAAAGDDVVQEAIDVNATDESVLGSWQDVDDSSRFANITKDSSGKYIWEDNDGKYEATFKEGVLSVTVEEGQTAQAHYDNDAKQLVLVFGTQEFKFQKK